MWMYRPPSVFTVATVFCVDYEYYDMVVVTKTPTTPEVTLLFQRQDARILPAVRV